MKISTSLYEANSGFSKLDYYVNIFFCIITLLIIKINNFLLS